MLNVFEQLTQVSKTFLILGSATVVLTRITDPIAAPISNLVGWALPAYFSLEALECRAPQINKWLTYWIFLGFVNLLESTILGIILYFVPSYFAWKTVLVLWLLLPNFRVRASVLTVFRLYHVYVRNRVHKPSMPSPPNLSPQASWDLPVP